MNLLTVRKEISDCLDKINEARHPTSHPATIEQQVTKIINLLHEIQSMPVNENFKSHVSVAISSVIHTKNKEVRYIDLAYKKTLAKNAAKIRKAEYVDTIKKALEHLYIDLNYVLHGDAQI